MMMNRSAVMFSTSGPGPKLDPTQGQNSSRKDPIITGGSGDKITSLLHSLLPFIYLVNIADFQQYV
jgi:hypothetical protein